MDTDNDRAAHHAAIAEKLLARIKVDKKMGREMDVKDGQNAAVATAHATLALYYSRGA